MSNYPDGFDLSLLDGCWCDDMGDDDPPETCEGRNCPRIPRNNREESGA